MPKTRNQMEDTDSFVEPKKKRGRPPGSISKKTIVPELEPHISATGKVTVKYLNNADMLKAVVESKAKGAMSDTLARMLMMLVKRYASKPNWSGYTYNDDMQSFALLMLSRTWASFNEQRSKNCFAYYTQCAKNSFIQYLTTEKKSQRLRDELMIEEGLLPSYSYQLDYATKHHNSDETEYNDRVVSYDHMPDKSASKRGSATLNSQFDNPHDVQAEDIFDEDHLDIDDVKSVTPQSMCDDFSDFSDYSAEQDED